MFTPEQVARICHEANSALRHVLGEEQSPSFDDPTMKDSSTKGVLFRLANPNSTPAQQHEAWMASKLADGWKHGQTLDRANKVHPCMVTYDQLPIEQRLKDSLFQAIVGTFAEHIKE